MKSDLQSLGIDDGCWYDRAVVDIVSTMCGSPTGLPTSYSREACVLSSV